MAIVRFDKEEVPGPPWPNVILIDNICYELKGDSKSPPDTDWSDVEETFDDCESCLYSCEYEWSVEYDCSTGEWGEVTLENVDCITTASCAGTFGWIFDNEVDDICTYINIECVVSECLIPGDCGAGVAPEIPTYPFDCPCASSSSSSSSALSSSSSSEFVSSSSSSSAGPGPGPQPEEGRFI